MMEFSEDLWGYLARQKKAIVLYGMGDGADKILTVCQERGIAVCDFFASDGFVRGQKFHEKTVLSFSACVEKYGAENMIVLIAFASSLPEVMATMARVASLCETYVPDVPVAGGTLFDCSFYRNHQEEFSRVEGLLSDEISLCIYRDIIEYKLTGKLDILQRATTTKAEIWQSVLQPEKYEIYADLGAYTGDTVRELLSYAPHLRLAYCMEPDRHSFRKLSEYAAGETRCRVLPYPMCAWNQKGVQTFGGSGSRSAALGGKRGKALEVETERLDEILAGGRVDYIKYDVEGAEREALEGSAGSIRAHHPDLLLSLYHRSEDLFALPLQLQNIAPGYRFYLRRFPYVPAWDLNLYAVWQ